MNSPPVAFLAISALLVSLIPSSFHTHLVHTDEGEFYAGMMHQVASAGLLLPALTEGMLTSEGSMQAASVLLY